MILKTFFYYLSFHYDPINESNTLTSGDFVEGRVVLEVTKEIKVDSFFVKLTGDANARRKVRLHDIENSNYYSQLCNTFISCCNVYRRNLIFPNFRNMPPSFKGNHGWVKYVFTVKLSRPWKPTSTAHTELIFVLRNDGTNDHLLSPQAGTKEKTLCCWFCTSGPISLSAKIERKGYTPGESIQIFAEIENCSSRMVVPKAAIYQTQTFFAKGKMKEIKQLVANIRGESLSSGKTETWNGKMLKIPPVSPSILDCSIIRVEYSLMVYVDIPGAMNLSLNLPLVVGTIPLHPFGSRTSSVSSQCSMTMSWLGLPERPEAPPAYAEVVTEEQRPSCLEVSSGRENFDGPLFAYIQEFRFRPPPPYSEIDPNPDQDTSAAEQRLDTCPSR
uniref:Arrestin domain-containing protein 3 n=2 Tax=Sinocyclocheilus grahami TaxID=75366 RepID=A0A672K2M2_SINGR